MLFSWIESFQNTLDEIIATTAYLELFIRTISEPILLRVFLKFICVEKFEDQKIIDTLILRIDSQSRVNWNDHNINFINFIIFQLCVVNLVLFRTLIDLNCEDFMLELIFKYVNNWKLYYLIEFWMFLSGI